MTTPTPRRRARAVEPQIKTPIRTFRQALEAAAPRPLANGLQADKKNYAERLSRSIATLVANLLRRDFPGITPDEYGKNQEQRARVGTGYKKLDVGFSTNELGLGLGVSVKTLNFPDPKNGRFTKNFTRIDNELRAEADDYHERQPYSVLVGIVFLPIESCDDGRRHPSSFASAIPIFRKRNRRTDTVGRNPFFERIFIALYDAASGEVAFFDTSNEPPAAGRPSAAQLITLDALRAEIASTFEHRNPRHT
jgi:hypothetical protein